MIAWYWALTVAVAAFMIGVAWRSDAKDTRLDPPGNNIVLVPMDDYDAIALGEGIAWTFGTPREQDRLRILRDRYFSARLQARRAQ